MQYYKAIIFDLDGTLCDTVLDVHNSINLALQKMQLPQLQLAQSRLAIGPGPDEFARIILGEHLHRVDEFRQVFTPIYMENCSIATKPFPGIIELLENLKLDYHLAVATNKAYNGAVQTLKGSGLLEYFSTIITRDDVKNPKPAADMLLFACEKFAITTEQALFVGDTDNDIYAANAANIHSALALWGYSQQFDVLRKISTFSIEHPLELLNILKD